MPKNLFKIVLLSLAMAFCLQAQAQRTPVPVVDFVNIPVSGSATKPLTAEQVRKAIMAAGDKLSWTIKPVSDGVLEARFVKGNGRHTVVASIQYTAEAYSLTYQDSLDMKFEDRPIGHDDPVRNPASTEAVLIADRVNAAAKQARLFANDPSTPYQVVRQRGILHPFYERWVRQLLGAVRSELKTQ